MDWLISFSRAAEGGEVKVTDTKGNPAAKSGRGGVEGDFRLFKLCPVNRSESEGCLLPELGRATLLLWLMKAVVFF